MIDWGTSLGGTTTTKRECLLLTGKNLLTYYLTKIIPLNLREREGNEGTEFKLRKSHVNCHENTKGSALSLPWSLPSLIMTLLNTKFSKETRDLKLREFKEIWCGILSLTQNLARGFVYLCTDTWYVCGASKNKRVGCVILLIVFCSHFHVILGFVSSWKCTKPITRFCARDRA